MLRRILFAAGVAAALGFAIQAEAGPMTFSGPFSFSGHGISGSGAITVGPYTAPSDTTDGLGRHDPASAFRVLSITGTVTDAALGWTNLPITGLLPVSPTAERDSPLDPFVPTSLSYVGGTLKTNSFSYDDLYYPDGAPIVCEFNFTGTSVDPFGMAFTVQGGDIVDLWGDGNFGNGGPLPSDRFLTYGVGVLASDWATNPTPQLVNQFAGVSASFAVPEPGSGGLIAAGLLLLVGFTMGPGAIRDRRRKATA